MKENRLVVADRGWAESVPDWLREAVEAERLVDGFSSVIKKETKKQEACLYLYTASLKAPMSHELSEAYIYLGAKLMKKRGKEIPDFMEKKLSDGLMPDEELKLKQLKHKLYVLRGGEIKSQLFDLLKKMGSGYENKYLRKD